MTQTSNPPQQTGGEPWRVSREDYHRMIDSGVLDGQRVELVRGRILNMSPVGLPHEASLMKSGRVLRKIFPEDQFTIRTQMSFSAANDSQPEPDICVISGDVNAISSRPTEPLLIVEISETSLLYDRTVKAELYAESGVAEYWIINLIDRVVELYRHPHQVAGGKWTYDAPAIKRAGDGLDVLAMLGGVLATSDLLP